MSELVGPTFLFDADLGGLVEEIDVDPDAIASELRERGLTDEAINGTVIKFTSDAWELPAEEGSDEVRVNNAVTLGPRYVLVFMGSYAIAGRNLPDVAVDALISLKMSEDLAHEVEHLRQHEDGELTAEHQSAEVHLPYHDRSWEKKGVAQGDAYMDAFRRGEREFLAWVIFKSF